MEINYLTDKNGHPLAVVVPIDEWESIRSRLDRQAEDETAYLLESQEMRQRLALARSRKGGKTLEEVKNALGI
ncbi:hypothetical protein [Desulfonatronum parangueonense]